MLNNRLLMLLYVVAAITVIGTTAYAQETKASRFVSSLLLAMTDPN